MTTQTPPEPNQPLEPDPEHNQAPGLIPPDPDQPSGARHADPGVEDEDLRLEREAEDHLAERDGEATSPAVEAENNENR